MPKPSTSPTARTLKWLRDNEYSCQVVERYNQFAYKRIDLFGCIDIVAIKKGESGVLGVQSTSGSHMADHFKKSIAIPELKLWLETGNRFIIQTWRKNSKNRWVSREREVILPDIWDAENTAKRSS